MKKFLMAAAAATFAMGTAAYANSISIVGGSYGTIPGSTQAFTPENNVLEALGLGSSLGGYFGSTIDFGTNKSLRIDLIGSEAGNTNTFSFGGVELFSGGANGGNNFNPATDVGNPLASTTVATAGGIADFVFSSLSTKGAMGSVANGSNPDENPLTSSAPFAINFFASFGPGNESATSGNTLWLFLDDIGQSGGDNHDDLVIRISAVPLPAGALLLISGLGALALRRKRSA